MRCKYCGAKIKTKNKFCAKCGNLVSKKSNIVYVCPECSTEVPEEAQFCHKCGTRFNGNDETSIEYVCPNCGENMKPDATFCNKCGYGLRKKKRKKKVLGYLILALSLILLLVGVKIISSNLKSDRDNQIVGKEDDIREPSQELQEEVKEETKTYETMTELKNAIKIFVQETYADGSVTCYSDAYTDTTFVELDEAFTTILNQDGGYGIIFNPHILAGETEAGVPFVAWVVKIEYASNAFLDYLFSSDCIFLAEDGTRCSLYLEPGSQREDDDLYFTDLLGYYDMSKMDELDSLYKVVQKPKVSMRIDQVNSNDEFVTIDLDEPTLQNLRKSIEIFKEICEGIY